MNAFAELASRPQWVAWTYEDRGGDKPTKPPISPCHGRKASVNQSSDWASCDLAKQFAEARKLPGIGYVLTNDDGLTGIDLDKCRNAENGDLEPWAAEIVALGETYAEVSPSGTGLRLIARGKVPTTIKCDPAHVEIYRDKRYLTITGKRLEGAPDEIRAAPQTLESLLARVASFERPRAEAPAIAPAAIGEARASKGASTFREINDAALADLSAWVPVLFPGAKLQAGTRAFRVSSRDLGRDLQEDLSIAPSGIVDFGVADMGDARQGRRTPIDCVIVWGGAPDASSAARWLAERLGKSFDDRREIPAEIADAVAGMIERASEAKGGKPHGLAVVNAATLAGTVPPPREFLAPGLIPGRTVTMLSGDGGTGKSLLALQLAVSVAIGAPWLGMEVSQGGVLYVSAEDELDEVHRRLLAIASAEGFDLADFDRLSIVPLAGDCAILAAPDREGTLKALPLWAAIGGAVERLAPSLIVLDTLADFFGGNEINRAEVRQFLTMLRGVALKSDCAILLLSHPSVAGMNSGTGLSGSTAWNNSVRSRLYFDYVRDEAKRVLDPDLRVLRVMKANYASVGDEIRMRWLDGRFVAETPTTGLAKEAAAARAERVFLDLLAKMAAQKRDVSAKPGHSYAPAIFEKHPNAEGIRRRDFASAMERLFDAGGIEVEMTGPPSKRVSRIVATAIRSIDE